MCGHSLQKQREVSGVDVTGKWRTIGDNHPPLAPKVRANRMCSVHDTYIVCKELQNKSGHTAIDADEEVHTGEDHIGSAGDLEHKGCWVHERSDRPPGETQT